MMAEKVITDGSVGNLKRAQIDSQREGIKLAKAAVRAKAVLLVLPCSTFNKWAAVNNDEDAALRLRAQHEALSAVVPAVPQISDAAADRMIG
jgi:hypothetical protein